MPKTRKQNRRRRRKGTRRGGAPLPTTYSTKLQQFLLDNYDDASLEVLKQFQDAGVSFSDARKYLGNKDIHFTPQQIVSLKNRGWSQIYIDGQNGTVPYELLMAFDPETHVDPEAYSAPNNLDQTVVELFEAPTNDLSFSNAQIEQLIDLGLNDDNVIEEYEREVAAGNKTFEDVINELRPGSSQMNYQVDNNTRLNVRQREEDDSGRNIRQRLNSSSGNGSSSNRSLHVSDLVNGSSSNGLSSNRSLHVSDLVNGSSSNGLSSNRSLHVSDLVDESYLDGGKRKRKTMKKRGKTFKSKQ